MAKRLIILMMAAVVWTGGCSPAQSTRSAPTDTFPPPAATATNTTTPTMTATSTITSTPTKTPTLAPTFFPTLNSYALNLVPNKNVPVAVTIYDDTMYANATLTGTYGGIRDGGTASSKLAFFFPHTTSFLLWRDGTTRCTSPYRAYPSGVERVSLYDVTALEFTAEHGTCNGTVVVMDWPDGRRTTKAIVSRAAFSGNEWQYGDVATNDDLVIYVAYGPVAIPLPMVRKIALLKME